MKNIKEGKQVGKGRSIFSMGFCLPDGVPRLRSKLHGFPVACMLFVAMILAGNGAAIAQDFDHTHGQFDGVLKQFVQNGLVDYAGLKANPGKLDRYLDSLAKVTESQFNSWNEIQRLACLINLYNAATLRLILNHYPLKSIKDIGSLFKGPWDQPVVRFFGRTLTLNTLEHEILRKKYTEPGIHMALVCAAMGCPPLRGEAYVAEKLDAQLDDQAKQFLGNSIKFRIDRKKSVVFLSPIFKWYGEDFRGKYSPRAGFDGLNETQRAVVNFCSRYLSPEDRSYLEAGGYSIDFLDYDWSLNERQAAK